MMKEVVNQNEGIEIVTKVDGREAVNCFKEQFASNQIFDGARRASIFQIFRNFDVVILDLNMPKLDGFEACKQITQIFKDNFSDQLPYKMHENNIDFLT